MAMIGGVAVGVILLLVLAGIGFFIHHRLVRESISGLPKGQEPQFPHLENGPSVKQSNLIYNPCFLGNVQLDDLSTFHTVPSTPWAAMVVTSAPVINSVSTLPPDTRPEVLGSSHEESPH